MLFSFIFHVIKEKSKTARGKKIFIVYGFCFKVAEILNDEHGFGVTKIYYTHTNDGKLWIMKNNKIIQNLTEFIICMEGLTSKVLVDEI